MHMNSGTESGADARSEMASLPAFTKGSVLFSSAPGCLRTAEQFRKAVAQVDVKHRHVINVCRDRHTFLVVVASAMSSGRTTLLPPSGATDVISETRSAYEDSVVIDDDAVRGMLRDSSLSLGKPGYAEDFIAAIGHTSGSTGTPTPHRKKWSSLRHTSHLNAEAIRRLLPSSYATARPWIVATVPSQHMYGFELAALLPLLEGFSIQSGHPLFPADVAEAVASVPAPRILVTTPVHLRALAGSGLAMPPIAAVISATAPLAPDLAMEVESRFGAPLLEMFGSTETCVLATRRPSQDVAWKPYKGIRLEPGVSGTIVRAPWLAEHTVLQDILEIRADGSFTVTGRNTDMVDIAGKRASLADMNRRLGAIPGVEDCHVLQSEEADSMGVRRLAALVVAPGMTPEQIADALRPSIDPVFMPRPLLLVKILPRDTVGKIARRRALDLIEQLGRRPRDPASA